MVLGSKGTWILLEHVFFQHFFSDEKTLCRLLFQGLPSFSQNFVEAWSFHLGAFKGTLITPRNGARHRVGWISYKGCNEKMIEQLLCIYTSFYRNKLLVRFLLHVLVRELELLGSYPKWKLNKINQPVTTRLVVIWDTFACLQTAAGADSNRIENSRPRTGELSRFLLSN